MAPRPLLQPDWMITGRRSLTVFLMLGAFIVLGGLTLFSPEGPTDAHALPQWVHATAQDCADCHHSQPIGSFFPCLRCHGTPEVPNTVCQSCHANKVTEVEACWTCHEPGQDMPAWTSEACLQCHGTNPHPFSQWQGQPDCTFCHEQQEPSPHHDGVDQVAPSACRDCHSTSSHNGVGCTSCHSTEIHPNYPEVPTTCFQCHASATFGGQPSCLTCHYGAANFGGVGDDDIHDTSIPDPPITGDSCTTCHAGFERHAGEIDCETCHFQATEFHHNRASTPGYLACESCHGEMPQHGQQDLPCQQCHQDAIHNLNPQPPGPGVCNICHAPANFGVGDCLDCHAPPVYHADPTVPGCTSHHGPVQIHDNLGSCEACHNNPVEGHHLTQVNIPDCRACHEQDFHVGQIACSRCHQNAAHDNTPRNLPTPVWDVCMQCHPFAAKAPACSECHDETQHSTTYRVPDNCNACHDKRLHAGKVQCESCHLRIESGHHNDGPVTARSCSDCHVGAEVHAASTEGGSGFGCSTCHEGGVHGVVKLPNRERCMECHEEASEHAGDLECIQCHWPAAHDASPVAGEFGKYEPLALRLPPQAAALGDEGEARDEFSGTGADLRIYVLLGGALMMAGMVARYWRRPQPLLLPGSQAPSGSGAPSVPKAPSRGRATTPAAPARPKRTGKKAPRGGRKRRKR